MIVTRVWKNVHCEICEVPCVSQFRCSVCCVLPVPYVQSVTYIYRIGVIAVLFGIKITVHNLHIKTTFNSARTEEYRRNSKGTCMLRSEVSR